MPRSSPAQKRVKTLLGSSAVALALSTACQAAQYISLDVPGASDTFPQAINKYGVITGNYCAGTCSGFVRTPDGTITTFTCRSESDAAHDEGSELEDGEGARA